MGIWKIDEFYNCNLVSIIYGGIKEDQQEAKQMAGGGNCGGRQEWEKEKSKTLILYRGTYIG
jgi:hypothetical protein